MGSGHTGIPPDLSDWTSLPSLADLGRFDGGRVSLGLNFRNLGANLLRALAQNLIIAIDGPVGSGKSTVARRAAEMLGYVYIDTGAMYRAVALKALRRGVAIDPKHAELLEALARETRIDLRAQDGWQQILLDGVDVTAEIRTPEAAQAASKIAVIAGVRHVLVAEQRRAGQQGGVVMEGRDIGSVVFPDAQLKIFLTASAEVRAERRWREHQQKGDRIDLGRTLEEIHERDRRDRERATSPLVRAADAVVLDSTAMEPEEVARLVVLLAREQGEGERPQKPTTEATEKSPERTENIP